MDSDEVNISQEKKNKLTATQLARIERQRLRARALRDSRPLLRNEDKPAPVPTLGCGGGFLPEETHELNAVVAPCAPLVHPGHQPHCLHCGRPFPQSFLYDNFDYSICDECRDTEGEHALMTRTEAKNEYLLKDCDLDSREPPLRCLRRRNPHSARFGDMRLYLRAQLQERALQVWGSHAALDEERARREGARAAGAGRRAVRRLRALRMDVRSSLYTPQRAAHEHEFGPETHDARADVYSRSCLSCGHTQSYEKM
ncbi:DNA repair protein complementing XP-A cells homolog [Bombyx mori]|uniref:XPA C-terminal domain-containing protein n=1 Tax=Bombyx mori TaxID=7091 RepID=A0A8R2QTK0_BOMMO|nr:DNA repair protein complementing XP-A cells homolog [Bombyx mori]